MPRENTICNTAATSLHGHAYSRHRGHAPDVKATLEQLNQFPVGNTPEEFAAFLQENMARLAKTAHEANVKLD